MDKVVYKDLEYLGTLNAHGAHQETVKSIMDCVINYGYSISKPIRMVDDSTLLKPKQKEFLHHALQIQIEESKKLILNNFRHLPLVACSYNVAFDKYGNTVLLLARKDLPKLSRDFTPADIDLIKWYHPETGELQHGVDGLIDEVDKTYILGQMSKSKRESIEKVEKQGTLERICKLVGGKDKIINEQGKVDFKKFTQAQIAQRVGMRGVHDEALFEETREETGREKVEHATPFAYIREIKDAFIKDALIYVSKVGGKRGPKTFSDSEIQQDLVEIYLPTHMARAIAHETFQAKVRESAPKDHKRKMSSCARTLLTMGYVRDHENELKKLIR